jgi:5-methylcytosine-specific restriction endonuclease McrA
VTSPGGRKQSALTAEVLRLYGTVCALCGGEGADTKDHIIPRSLGGSDALDNLRPAHRRCNSRRGNRPARRGGDGQVTRRGVV